jgi:tRNA G46 methylase TrmB
VVPRHSVDCVYINFPEPALKKRHERWRLIDDKLLVQIRDAMVPRADLHMVTDDAQLMDVIVTTARRANTLFEPMDAPPAHFVTERPDYVRSVSLYSPVGNLSCWIPNF